ncbi:hypothetical protein AMS69_05640 [Haloarcula rubripromontorii]|uniref:Uncharacterized protein n=1 Tax=Haloarcula rubripromontorii TaxID=1705562 RepID=A0A0M9AJM4_9EURY|nr:hypothetical protein AMS69_05640 [Haloarcula rubripromontorii]
MTVQKHGLANYGRYLVTKLIVIFSRCDCIFTKNIQISFKRAGPIRNYFIWFYTVKYFPRFVIRMIVMITEFIIILIVNQSSKHQARVFISQMIWDNGSAGCLHFA